MNFVIGARRFIAVGGAAAGLCVAWPSVSQASTSVLPGFDLFQTRKATQVELEAGVCGNCPLTVRLEGVPLGMYDFGGGAVATGRTDTIVQRLETATVADPEINIEIVALHLKSQALVDLGDGAGPEWLEVTLNEDMGSTMTISGLDSEGTPHGTFDSSLQFTYDLSGSESGYIGTFYHGALLAMAELWNHACRSPSALRIEDVNYLLNGIDTNEDFCAEQVRELALTVLHMARHATPSLTTGGLILLGGLLSFTGVRTIRRRQTSE